MELVLALLFGVMNNDYFIKDLKKAQQKRIPFDLRFPLFSLFFPTPFIRFFRSLEWCI
jgi:hypothetical protein